MNTEFIVHPKLHHLGLATANPDAMVDWYRTVLGMTINHRLAFENDTHPSLWRSATFVSNDEVNHRIVFFEIVDAVDDADKQHHTGMQHVAFEYPTIDDLLGTYVRLSALGIRPVWAADHGTAIAIYYHDPDRNTVELNVDNYSDEWTATELMRHAAPSRILLNPDRMVTAREAGASAWALHVRAMAGEFTPENPPDTHPGF